MILKENHHLIWTLVQKIVHIVPVLANGDHLSH